MFSCFMLLINSCHQISGAILAHLNHNRERRLVDFGFSWHESAIFPTHDLGAVKEALINSF